MKFFQQTRHCTAAAPGGGRPRADHEADWEQWIDQRFLYVMGFNELSVSEVYPFLEPELSLHRLLKHAAVPAAVCPWCTMLLGECDAI